MCFFTVVSFITTLNLFCSAVGYKIDRLLSAVVGESLLFGRGQKPHGRKQDEQATGMIHERLELAGGSYCRFDSVGQHYRDARAIGERVFNKPRRQFRCRMPQFQIASRYSHRPDALEIAYLVL